MPLIYTQLAVDNFQRPNENPITPANWTTVSGAVALAVVSHLCESPDAITFSADGQAFYSGVSFPPDQYAEITLASLTPPSFVYTIARTNIGGTTGYSASCSGPFGDAAGQIDLINETTQVTLGTRIGVLNIGDIVRLECIGTSISVKLNGSTIISAVDATEVSGLIGVNISPFSAVGDAAISHFAAGYIVSGSPSTAVFIGPGILKNSLGETHQLINKL